MDGVVVRSRIADVYSIFIIINEGVVHNIVAVAVTHIYAIPGIAVYSVFIDGVAVTAIIEFNTIPCIVLTRVVVDIVAVAGGSDIP